MCREMTELFGSDVTIYPNLSYQDYLTQVEKGSLTIDSYPFGGYNTIVDSLFTGCPVVTIEGTKFYNRASTALTRRVGVDLSTSSIAECEKRVLLLLQNPTYLEQERAKLVDEEHLRKLLLDTDEPQYFVKAITHILANHPIADKSPVIIQ
jgi:predicted O-linked N-acetylglucosamine transferase (SPINDLY family)